MYKSILSIAFLLFATLLTFAQTIDCKDMEMQFEADSIRVEMWLQDARNVDNAIKDRIDTYSILINMYFELLDTYNSILLESLEAKEKEAFRATMEGWINFYNKECAFLWEVYHQRKQAAILDKTDILVVTDKNVNLLRNRLFKIYEYLILINCR